MNIAHFLIGIIILEAFQSKITKESYLFHQKLHSGSNKNI